MMANKAKLDEYFADMEKNTRSGAQPILKELTDARNAFVDEGLQPTIAGNQGRTVDRGSRVCC